MYIGEGSDFGTWFTKYVEIPADTPNKEISNVATETLRNGPNYNFVFCGVYAIPDLDDEINNEDF